MRKILTSANAACPCNSSKTYGVCCGVWHLGFRYGHYAPTPEALMRARYSAYTLGMVDYLIDSWHPSTAPGELDLPVVKWAGLDVLHTAMDQDAGVVEFVARYREKGKSKRLHEVSRFSKDQGRWLYIDGEVQDDGD